MTIALADLVIGELTADSALEFYLLARGTTMGAPRPRVELITSTYVDFPLGIS